MNNYVSILLVGCLWLLVSATVVAQTAEQKAVRAVCERETQAWTKRDADALLACWANVPEATHLDSSTEGRVGFVPHKADALRKMVNDYPAAKESFQTSDFRVRVNGRGAFAQYAQVFTEGNGTKNYSRESRYVEKVGNDWKIINVISVYYKPDATAPAKQ